LLDWLAPLTVYGYFGIFLISLLGSLSIIIPIPYTVVLLSMSVTKQFDPLLLAVAAGVGSAIGKTLSYGVGYFGRRFVHEKYGKRLDTLLKAVDKYGLVLIFLFAYSPLPDDALFIPLGLMRYSFLKFFAVSVLGKFLMSLTIAYVGNAAGAFLVGSDTILSVMTIVMLVAVVAAMFLVDWEKLLDRYLPKEEKKP